MDFSIDVPKDPRYEFLPAAFLEESDKIHYYGCDCPIRRLDFQEEKVSVVIYHPDRDEEIPITYFNQDWFSIRKR